MGKGITIRAYEATDETAVRRGFREAFGMERSSEQWDWKFFKNPISPHRAAVGLDRLGELFMQVALWPFAVAGGRKPVTAAQIVDLYSLKGAGREFGLVAADQFICESAEKAGYPFLLAFPNQQSRGALVGLGWKELGYFETYFKRLDLQEDLDNRSPFGGLNRLVNSVYHRYISATLPLLSAGIQFSRTLPKDYPDFWERVVKGRGFCFDKSSQYLRWRFEENPGREFSYAYLHRENRIEALAIVSEGREMCIADLQFAAGEISVARELLDGILRRALEEKRRRVTFSGLGKCFSPELFKGFEWRNSKDGLVLIKLIDDSATPYLDPSNWTISWGDSDAL